MCIFLSSIQYPSGFVVNNNFTSFGSLNEVTDASQNIKYIENPEYNQRGQLIEYTLGNGVTTELLYDNYGSLTNITAGNIQDYEVGYDYNAGRITNRKDYLKDRFEVFQYDNLNRLTSASTGILSTNTQIDWMVMEYENNGNISSKTGLGSYHYHDEKINAVVDVDNNDLSIPSFNQMITMTSFSRTESIEGFNDEDTYFISFSYDAHHDRIQSQLFKNNEIIKTKLYLGIYEIEYDLENNIERHIHYIPGHNGICAIHVVTNGSNETLYSYTDHLGSIVALTDASGNVVHEQNFDVWGQRRNPETWLYDDYTHNYDFDWVRGFTGHEHHDEFGIINMNNRMYDPVLARMMGADNFVQSPYFSQSYNRYSYVWNNPMSYTDPTGDFVAETAMVVGTIVGAYIGASVANNSFSPAQWTLRPTLIGGGIGAVAGAFGGFYIGKSIVAANALASGAAPTTFLAKSGVFIKSPAFKSGMLAGGMNAFKNQEEGMLAYETIGNFGSGFIGGYMGIDCLGCGMVSSAVGNMVVYAFRSEPEFSSYKLAQKAVSGALAAYSGVGAFGDVHLAKFKNGDYVMGSKNAAKAWRAGWYNVVSDWAHTSQYDWNKRENRAFSSFYAFVGGFTGGLINAYGTERYQEILKRRGFGQAYLYSLGMNTAAGAAEYTWTQLGLSAAYGSGNYLPWGYQYGLKKAAIWSYKSLMYGFTGKIAK
mgnify:CR=1 FL=1